MLKNYRQIIPSISFIVLILVVISLAPSALASFNDVSANSQNFDAINYAQQNGIVNGYSDGTFHPDATINRAEFVKISSIAGYNYDSTKDPLASSYDIFSLTGLNFKDLKVGEWDIPFIRYYFQKGIINGYQDGTFRPTAEITFSEASKIIVKSFNYQTPDDTIWYRPFVNKLAELKAIPTTITSFNQKITRAEMVEIIYRIKTNNLTKASLDYAALENNQSASSSTPRISSNCTVYPSDNSWNRDISKDPVDSNSADYLNTMLSSGNKNLHADFGGNGLYGIPYSVVDGNQPKVPINIVAYPQESDLGPYPIPSNAVSEGGSDSHVIAVDKDNCLLYELYQGKKTASGWNAGSAAKFDLKSNALRPDGWTSADAAGLPIFPGLVRYDEVAAGQINHAIRFTVPKTQKGYIHPATHFASSSLDTNLPPMGLKLRLKSNYDLSKFTGQSRIILEALKKYGMILADNGSAFFITGAADKRWDDNDLNQLKTVPGSAFEAVQSGAIQH